MDRVLESNLDKRTVFETENKNKILNEKNKVLLTEVQNLRKDYDHKETELEKALAKAAQLEKKLVLQQRFLHQQQIL